MNLEDMITKEDEKDKIKGAIEAILFSVGDKVDLDDFVTALELDKKVIKGIIAEMIDEYELNGKGVQIIQLEDAYQMCTKPAYYDQVSKVVNIPKKHVLTDVVLETLSIIAYKQPITRQEIEAIRGVSSVHAVNRLVEYNLVKEVGRLDAIGRPILFGTTDDFLRSFGVHSTDELPVITPDRIEDFKKEAMNEASLTLDV